MCASEKDDYGRGRVENILPHKRCEMVTLTMIHVNFLHRISGRCANHITRNWIFTSEFPFDFDYDKAKKLFHVSHFFSRP